MTLRVSFCRFNARGRLLQKPARKKGALSGDDERFACESRIAAIRQRRGRAVLLYVSHVEPEWCPAGTGGKGVEGALISDGRGEGGRGWFYSAEEKRPLRFSREVDV